MQAMKRLDGLAVTGCALASVGAGALFLEIKNRGLWGFITSWVDLVVVCGLFLLAAGLSWWALQRAEGWSKLLAGIGVTISVGALVAIVVSILVRFALANPDVFSNNSKSRRNRRRRGRGRNSRRRSW